MKSYWDSSALIDVILNQPAARSRFLSERDKVTRCHTLAESFSQLTGGRLGHKLAPDIAADIVRRFAEQMTIVSLNDKETLAALAQCRKRGVRGGAVHDFLHAYAAELHECKTIFTGNTADFIAVTGLKVLKP